MGGDMGVVRASCVGENPAGGAERTTRSDKPSFARRALCGAMSLCLSLALVASLAPQAAAQTMARIKDLVTFEGVRGNDLVGYGLVVGLDGTGDNLRSAPFTEEAISNLLEQLGVNIQGEDFSPRNVAAVIVTATLPPFARVGSQIDVTVSAIGDADSLLGGTLVMTPLNAADAQIYAVAQGPVLAGGTQAQGDAAEVVTGVPTSGTVPNGARVEREVPFELASLNTLRLALRDSDFTTALRIEETINQFVGRPIAQMTDAGTVELNLELAGARSPAHLISQIENLRVSPSQIARVVVDQRSGTIVLGADVRISQVAVSQGNLTIRVEEFLQASQPNPFAAGETIELPRTEIQIEDGAENRVALIPANVTLADLVDGLNALGVGPRGIIDILKAIKAAGALHAEFIVQ